MEEKKDKEYTQAKKPQNVAIAAAGAAASSTPYGAVFVQVTKIFGDAVTFPRISPMVDPWGEILYSLPDDLSEQIWRRALTLPGAPSPADPSSVIENRIKREDGYTNKATKVDGKFYDAIKLEEAVWVEVHRRKLSVPVPWQDPDTGYLYSQNLIKSLESFVAAALGVDVR